MRMSTLSDGSFDIRIDPDIWIAQAFRLDFESRGKPQRENVIVLYDPSDRYIYGFALARKRLPRISSINLIRETVATYPAPDIIKTTLVSPGEADFFCGTRHYRICFSDKAVTDSEKEDLEAIFRNLRKRIPRYLEDSDSPREDLFKLLTIVFNACNALTDLGLQDAYGFEKGMCAVL